MFHIKLNKTAYMKLKRLYKIWSSHVNKYGSMLFSSGVPRFQRKLLPTSSWPKSDHSRSNGKTQYEEAGIAMELW